MSRTAARVFARQLDFVEWGRLQQADLGQLRKIRVSEEKTILGYLKDFRAFLAESRQNKAAKKEKAAAEKALKAQAEAEGVTIAELRTRLPADSPLLKYIGEEKKADAPVEPDTVQQYFMSQDLLKRMKWKRVTWDADADYEGFARRIHDNDSVFAKVPAFSFTSLHLVHDPRNARVDMGSNSTQMEAGSLTKWLLQERTPAIVHPFTPTAPRRLTAPNARPQGPPPLRKGQSFSVDWVSGEASISDCISSFEMYLFLMTVAPRLQAVQVRMDQEQTKLTEDLEHCRVRLGAAAIKFNKYDRSVWDDPQRKLDPENYVDPAELRQFIDSVLARSFLLRRFLRRHQIRVVKPGRPYEIDMAEKEIRIPANFADYNYLPLHQRYESLEKFVNAVFRRVWWLWFALGLLLVGDFELI